MKRLTLGCITLFATFAASGCIIESDSDPISLVYEECNTAYDCEAAADDCYTVNGAERMCSTECEFDTDCLDGGACIESVGGPNICFQQCRVDNDCDHPFLICDDGVCLPP